jgi:hypothetical protein
LKPKNELKFEKRIDSDIDHELHMHDLLEINVLLENEALFKQLNRTYSGTSGDVFIFRPYEPHYNLAKDAEKPIKWILVLFSPSIVRMIPYGYRLLYPFYTDAASPLIQRHSSYAKNIHEAAILGMEEQEKKLPGWESNNSSILSISWSTSIAIR